jgi:CMP/dCMP kinase
MIITIGGAVGSGKTTVAKAIARRFGLKHISAGEVFREMAKEKGMTLQEFSSHAEGNHEIDKELDRRQIELTRQGNAVIDGRLTGWLIDADIKIWLTAPLDVRAKRVANRENKAFQKALEETKDREKSEAKRYKEIYDIEITDMSPYDIVLNTELWNAENVIGIIEKMILSVQKSLYEHEIQR